MNALALICNLFADGPRSLQRLRAAGVSELRAVEELPVEELVVLLGTSTRAAERFKREAGTLGRRLGEEFLDDEDTEDYPPLEAVELRAPAARAERPDLLPGGLDGLDETACALLASAGVRSHADLVGCDAVTLAHETGLRFASVRRLQFLAGQRVAPAAQQVPRPQAGRHDSPAAREIARPAAGKVSLAERPESVELSTLEAELEGPPGDGPAGPFA